MAQGVSKDLSVNDQNDYIPLVLQLRKGRCCNLFRVGVLKYLMELRSPSRLSINLGVVIGMVPFLQRRGSQSPR